THLFDEERRVSDAFRLGLLSLSGVEVLHAGDVVPINSDLIHCVYHVVKPTISVVVRTVADVTVLPQLEFYWPHVAADPFLRDDLSIRRRQLVDFLMQTDVTRCVETLLTKAGTWPLPLV